MTIAVLVCGADGTQTVEEHEVADDWFAPTADVQAQRESNGMEVAEQRTADN